MHVYYIMYAYMYLVDLHPQDSLIPMFHLISQSKYTIIGWNPNVF